MIRRQFIGLAALSSLGGVAALSRKSLGQTRTITCTVQGFTCVTCATGLETLLLREKGVLAVQASYPAAKATITFDEASTSPEAVVCAIESMGFKALVQPTGTAAQAAQG